jgi:hypothetical protein
MLRLGLIVTILCGIGELLLSGLFLLVFVAFSGDLAGWPEIVIALVLALIGIIGTATRHIWGPLAVAGSAFVLLGQFASSGALPALAFGAAAIVGLAVAGGLWQTHYPEVPPP